MNRSTLVKILAAVAVLASAWIYRAPLGEWFGWKPTPAGEVTVETAAQVDPRAGHDMPAASKESPLATEQGGRKILYWQDPMHPAYRSDKPGIAPDCGMKLVPVYADEAEAMAEMPPGTVRLSAEKQQLVGVTLGRAEVRALSKTVRAVAKIAVDERSLTHAHTKVEGWLEDVFVNYVGESIRHGQPLFTLYSPELLSAQQEYLIALKAKRELASSPAPEIGRSTEALYAASRDRLRLWDVSDEQIRQLEETGQPQRTITFYAEHGGVVMERKALPHMRVEKNTDLYTIADLSRVWAIAEVYEYEAPLLSVGQPARMTLTALPGRVFTGKVSFIYPQLDSQTRTLKVRMDFDNPGMQLRPEMFANVEFEVGLGRKLVVPESAVLDSGLKQYVFLNRGDGYFEPREVRVGMRTGGFVVIDGGLQAGDEVVTSANFLIDSESKLKATASTAAHQH
jgi:RND family efflux transporter MFP subunit